MNRNEEESSLDGHHMRLSSRRPMKRSEVIARDLVEYIVDARLPPGATLPREKDMVEQLGVGRTTLREALRILETRGVLTIRSGPGGGPVVRHPQPGDLMESLLLILQFQRATLAEVMDARVWLEPYAARMAATRISPQEIERLKEINAEMEALVETDEDIYDPNQRFHSVISGATGNVVIEIFSDTMLTTTNSPEADFHRSREFKRTAVEGHVELIEAFEAKDPDAAEETMRRHVIESKERRLKVMPELMSRPLRWVQ
jgi:DNA-binding FadR family transcriptional regulator